MGLIAAAAEESYSGLLPRADIYNQYDDATRERMCRWNDSFTIDESRRQDRLVDNEIRQQNMGSWMTFALLVFFSILAFAAFMLTGSPHSFWFMTVPVANVIGRLFRPVFSRSSRKG